MTLAKPFGLLALGFVSLAVITCTPRKASTPSVSFSTLSQSFKTPDHKFASAPLWVWNADVTEEMISSQLQDLKNQGFGGVFIHPRAGLITPYMSQAWFDLCAFTLAEAKKLNMDVWIYDENSYPSGFAGGHVPAAMPESYNQGQMLELEKVTTLPDNPANYFIALKKDGESVSDITTQWAAEKGKKGDYYLFKKTFYNQSDWYGGFTYVDLMVKGVTEKFIEETMTGYEKVFGAEFGKQVPGIFSDEPNIETQRANNIRWTPDLFDTFQKKWGYSLANSLPSLFEEVGDWQKVRHNYYQTLLQLFIDRWSKPYYEYTNRKNLDWTGHYWEHEWPSPNVVPDNMAMYAWHQRPAIDMLFNQFDETSPHAQFGNVRSVKELSSIANQLDKKRTLSETYGGAGWELRMKDLKRLGDWEFVLGVNTLNQHLAHMTIMGARKYDYPQSFSYHNPWFPYYKNLNDYFTRLTFMLTSGQQQNKVLVIEPTTSVWMYYSRDHANPRFAQIGDEFQKFVTNLEQGQNEYDLGDENVIRDHGRIDDSQFVVGSRAYETVILPPGIENLDEPTYLLMEKFRNAGGQILKFSDIKRIDGKDDPRATTFNAAVPMADKQPGELLKKDLNFSFDNSSKGDLFHHRRRIDDGDILFLANASVDNSSKGSIDTKGTDVLLLNLFNGEIQHYPNQAENNSVHLEFNIPPAGSLMLFVADKKQSGFSEYTENSTSGSPVTAPTSVKRLSDNSLTIDFCDIRFGKSDLKNKHVYDATDTLFKYNGFKDGNPWNTSVQFKDKTLARDTFKTGSGFTATYHFTITDKIDMTTIKGVVERAGLYHVLVNDKPVSPVAGKWWLDRSFNILEIGPYLHIGINSLSLVADKMSVHSEIEPIYLLGNFSVTPAAHGWQLTTPANLKIGSWKDQGLPLYSQKVGYEKKVTIQKKADKHYWVQLGKWEGTVCEVLVNGKSAGTIAFDPYTIDISSYLKDGENLVEVDVIGSLKNTLGPFHNKPKAGLVSPWHFRYAKGYPAGKDYDLLNYGLVDDYQVVEQ